MIEGLATAEGTARYKAAFSGKVAADHFALARGLWFSSIGLGTYLGEPTSKDDASYEEAAREALLSGCNVLDTAINYRFQRSERTLGKTIAALIGERRIARDEFIVATKGGFIPFDGGYAHDPAAWVKETFLDTGVAKKEEIVADCHCIAPGYLDHQFEASRRNLGLEAIDIFYLHNPETQLQSVDRKEFLSRLRAAFAVLERKVGEGRLSMYGTATWDGYRTPSGDPGHISLSEVLLAAGEAARDSGSARHHFGAAQLPLNLAMPEALLHPTQVPVGPDGRPLPGRGEMPFLAASTHADLVVMASASILQGHLIAKMPADLAARIRGGSTAAQKAIQWVRSAPGLTTALVGMRSRSHVEENLALAADPRMSIEEFRAFLTPRH